MSRAQDLTIAFALGAVAGSVAALLLAPEKGEVTRMRLKDGARHLAKRGETFVGEIRSSVAEAAKVAAQETRHQVQAVKDAMAEGAKVYHEDLERSHV